ncbi:hypothetical protein GCM10012320_12360 [Sinomonas cellulolyticus]|nr:hypothetical protein GCM10012320_12360 [Sinomonas sp. KCTC 49339]
MGGTAGEHRRRAHAPPRDLRKREESVAAVVALAHDAGHAPSVHGARALELAQYGEGETVRGAGHEGSTLAAVEERPLGRADLGAGVRGDHVPESTDLWKSRTLQIV